MKKKCKHKRAIFCWSHSEYLGWCADCREEVSEKDIKKDK